MLALCQHKTLAYYAFYYAGIFDAGLELLKKEESKIQMLNMQILSYENLVKQEKLFNKSKKKGISDLENYSGLIMKSSRNA